MKTENARTDRAKPIWPSDYSQAGHKNSMNYRILFEISCIPWHGLPRTQHRHLAAVAEVLM